MSTVMRRPMQLRFWRHVRGNLIVYFDLLICQVVNRQPYFAPSLQDRYLQPPFYALGTGELTMVFSHPLLDANQQTVGVLAGRLDINTLGQIMTERAGLGSTGETYLV